jgi:outer membrane protein assembly factor BamB
MKPHAAQSHSSPVSLRIRWLAAGLAGCGLLASALGKKQESPAQAPTSPSVRQDWPMLGGSPSRNMASNGKNPPADFAPGKKVKGTDELDMATTKGLKWSVLLGSQSNGTPVVAGGCVFVGTNNENPRDPKYGKDDRSVLMCLDEKTGGLLWQMPCTKLSVGKVSDLEYIGLCSSPAVEGERVYVITNRCEVVCLDLRGMKNGNQGLQDEVTYYSSPDQPIIATGDLDADVIWRFDMRAECGVFPHNVSAGSVLLIGDRIYANTSNGVDWTHSNVPGPNAPALICLDKTTGKLLAEERSGISKRALHCSWSSPAASVGGQRDQIVFGGGDGFCYGFDPAFQKDAKGAGVFGELWRYDANPPHLRLDATGNRRPYNTFEGPSEIIATPVVYKDKAYILTGQDPEHGEGAGCLSCIDLSGRGDLSGKALWTSTTIGRSISTPSIVDDVIYAADYSGNVHALDALKGTKLWTYDTKGHIMCSSPTFIDGKIYIGNEEGELHIISAGRNGGKKIELIEFPGGLHTGPVYANGTLYVTTMSRLYAFGPAKAGL